MLAAVHFIERTLRDHRAELEAYPVDQDVARLDKIGAEKAKARRCRRSCARELTRAQIRRYVARWNFMPFWLRALMIWGAVFETISAYAFELAGSQCFVDFQITSSIDADLGGHVINLVKPMGVRFIARAVLTPVAVDCHCHVRHGARGALCFWALGGLCHLGAARPAAQGHD